MNKTEQLAKLSEELLADFEGGATSLEQIILKATKLVSGSQYTEHTPQII